MSVSVTDIVTISITDWLIRPEGNAAIKVIRFMYMDNQTKLPIQLVRGVPLFAEVEFVPRKLFTKSNLGAR